MDDDIDPILGCAFVGAVIFGALAAAVALAMIAVVLAVYLGAIGLASWLATRGLHWLRVNRLLKVAGCPLTLTAVGNAPQIVVDVEALLAKPDRFGTKFMPYVLGAGFSYAAARLATHFYLGSEWIIPVALIGVVATAILAHGQQQTLGKKLDRAFDNRYGVTRMSTAVAELSRLDGEVKKLSQGFVPPFDGTTALRGALRVSNERDVFASADVTRDVDKLVDKAKDVLKHLGNCLKEKARVEEVYRYAREVAKRTGDVNGLRNLDEIDAALRAKTLKDLLTKRRWDEFDTSLATIADQLAGNRWSRQGEYRGANENRNRDSRNQATGGERNGNRNSSGQSGSGRSPRVESGTGTVTWAFGIFGLTPPSSREEVSGHFKDLAKQLHPDRFNTASEAVKSVVNRQFQDLNSAHEVLKHHFAKRV